MADEPKPGDNTADAASAGQKPGSSPDASRPAAAPDTPMPPAAPKPAAASDVPMPPATPEPAAAPDVPKPAIPKPAAAAAPPPRPKPKPKAPPEAPKGPSDPPPPDDMARPPFLVALQSRLPEAVEQLSYWVGDWTVIVTPGSLLDVGRFLKESDEGSFDYCSDVTASDWPPREKRFDVIYCLYSTRLRHRVRIKVRAGEDEPVPSVTELWPAANWLERELWDMFGVAITGHPDLRRILMPENWQGHPQRKDYPLEGPGELLLEGPMEWLRLRNLQDEAEIE